MTKVTTSKQFSLRIRDFLKSFIMAIGTPVLYFIQESIPGYDLHPMAKVAISASITYLLKNYFEKPRVIITASDNTNAENIKDSLKE